MKLGNIVGLSLSLSVASDVLYNAKRLKLLLQPLRASSAKQEVVAQAKLDTWWHLVTRLGPKAAMNFDQVGLRSAWVPPPLLVF